MTQQVTMEHANLMNFSQSNPTTSIKDATGSLKDTGTSLNNSAYSAESKAHRSNMCCRICEDVKEFIK